VAWQFPILAASCNNDDDMLLVDCYDLPIVVDLDASLEDNSGMDESVSSDKSVLLQKMLNGMTW